MGAGGEKGGETGAAGRAVEGPFRRGEHSLGTQIPDTGLRRYTGTRSWIF